MKYKFEIRQTDWFKRRVPTVEPKAVSVEITGFELINNHKCVMIATYDNDEVFELSGRVSVNHVGKWTVAGYNPHGKMVMCDITEE